MEDKEQIKQRQEANRPKLPYLIVGNYVGVDDTKGKWTKTKIDELKTNPSFKLGCGPRMYVVDSDGFVVDDFMIGGELLREMLGGNICGSSKDIGQNRHGNPRFFYLKKE